MVSSGVVSKRAFVATAAVLMGLALASAAPGARTETTVVRVIMGDPQEFGFVLTPAAVPRGTILFRIENRGEIMHNFAIAGKRTQAVMSGRSRTLRLTLLRPGPRNYLCTLPSHAEAGMAGRLAVT